MQIDSTRDRIEWLATQVENAPGLDEFLRSRLRAVIEMVDSAVRLAAELSATFTEEFVEKLEPYMSMLPELLRTANPIDLAAWATATLNVSRRSLERYRNLPAFADAEDDLTQRALMALISMIEVFRLDEERMRALQGDLQNRARSATLADEAEATATRLQEAAGIVGDASLAQHFERYARREWWSANTFRVLTIVAIGGALWAAAVLAHPHEGDWVALSYRIAQLAGVAALATYLGRQAAQHRRVFNWARSMQVQLQSFPAFIEPITDSDTRSGIYNEFARRVLGPPPEKGPGSDDAYPNQQVIELLTVLAKKAQ